MTWATVLIAVNMVAHLSGPWFVGQAIDEAFRQITAALSQQYILSYYPDNEASMRGEFREISLTVKNKQGLTVKTRKGYYVPKR